MIPNWVSPFPWLIWLASVSSPSASPSSLFVVSNRRGKAVRIDANQINQGNGLTQFGIIPYLLKYCEVTNETLTDVMNESINLIFYIVSYEVLKAKEQERQLKQIRNKH